MNYYLYKLQFVEGMTDISKFNCLKVAIKANAIPLGEMKQHVYGVYKCSDQDNSVGRLYRQKIDSMLEAMFDGLANSSIDGNPYLTKALDHLHYHVMTSLRDTDKQIIVEMK